MKKLRKDYKTLSRGYKIIFSIDKMIIPLNMISAILESIFPFIAIFMGAEIVNALSRGDDLRHIYLLAIITLVLNFSTHQIKQFISHAIAVKNGIFENKFNMYMNNKILEMDYGSIEDPETHIKRQRIYEIRNMGGGGIWKLVYQSTDAVSGMITMITSVAITYKAFTVYSTAAQSNFINIITSALSSVILLIFIVVNTLITIYFNGVSTVKTHKIWDEALAHNRMLVYI